MFRRFALVAALLLAAASSPAQPVQGGSIPLLQPLFPPNNWWNTDVSAVPTDSNADAFLTFIGKTKDMHPDFGGDAGGCDIYGFPFIGGDPGRRATTRDLDDHELRRLVDKRPTASGSPRASDDPRTRMGGDHPVRHFGGTTN